MIDEVDSKGKSAEDLIKFYISLKKQGYEGNELDAQFFGILAEINYDSSIQHFFHGKYNKEIKNFKKLYSELFDWMSNTGENVIDFSHLCATLATFSHYRTYYEPIILQIVLTQLIMNFLQR